MDLGLGNSVRDGFLGLELASLRLRGAGEPALETDDEAGHRLLDPLNRGEHLRNGPHRRLQCVRLIGAT